MPGVERIVDVIVEIDVGVGARKDGLILAAALRVEARLDRVRTDDLRDVVNEVEGVVLIDERQPVEIHVGEGRIRRIPATAGTVDSSDPYEAEVRHITCADIRV